MTGETAKQWGSAGLGRREEAASQPQSDSKMNGGYDTEIGTFNEGPVPLSEAEMAEYGILDAHRAMTEEFTAAEKEPDALEMYSREKGIPAAVLRESLGCYAKGEALTIPYYDEQGQQRATRLRHGQGHDPRFSWLPKSDIIPYGLWLRLNQGSGAIVLA